MAWIGFSSSSNAVSVMVSDFSRTGVIRAGPQTKNTSGSRPAGMVRPAAAEQAAGQRAGELAEQRRADRLHQHLERGEPRRDAERRGQRAALLEAVGRVELELDRVVLGSGARRVERRARRRRRRCRRPAGLSVRKTRVSSVGLYWNGTIVGTIPSSGSSNDASMPLISAMAGPFRDRPAARARAAATRAATASSAVPGKARPASRAVDRRAQQARAPAPPAPRRAGAASRRVMRLPPCGCPAQALPSFSCSRRRACATCSAVMTPPSLAARYAAASAARLDAAAGQLGGGQRVPVERPDPRLAGERALPEAPAQRRVGRLEADHEAQPAQERLVDGRGPVGREERPGR